MKQLIKIIAESIDDADYEGLDDSGKQSEFLPASGSESDIKTLILPNSHVIVMTNHYSWDDGDTTSYQIDKGIRIEDIEQNDLAEIIFKYIDHFKIQQEIDDRPSNILDYMLKYIDRSIRMNKEKMDYYGRKFTATFRGFEEDIASLTLQRSNLLEGGRKAFVAFYKICRSELFEYDFSNFIRALQPK